MELTAGAIMSSPAIQAREDMTVAQLVALLNEHSISGVPVVDAWDRLVGVISITDLIALGADHQNMGESDFHTSPAMDNLSAVGGLLEPEEAIRDQPISSLMSRHVITAVETDPIGLLADMLVTHRIHRLVIIRGERIAGIVSIRDILCALQSNYRAGD